MQREFDLDGEDHPVFKVLPAIFRRCVGKYRGAKHDLRYPQQIGEHVYASDGRIMVRAVATPSVAVVIPDIAPMKFPSSSPDCMEPRGRWHDEPTPIPSLDHLDRCDQCGGTGHMPQRRCSCDDYDTPCHDRGIIPAGECWDCEGTGIEDPRETTVAVREDVHLSAYFLSLLERHGATLYLPREALSDESATPVYFTAGDVEGVVMTCKAPAGTPA